MIKSSLYKLLIYSCFIYTFTYSIQFNNKRKSLLLDINNNKQRIISSKNKKSFFGNQDIFVNNTELNYNKKLITISPGGCKGFYLAGILTFIKENYNITDCIFSGASAGAWNALFMCYKGDTMSLVYNILDVNIIKAKTLNELQYLLKYKLLSNYKTEDFDLRKVFIGVTTFKYYTPVINIYTDFDDLEDAINCCIASSHIPLVTGGISNRYKNLFSFDGGFSKYPYLEKERLLHISHSMWKTTNKNITKKENWKYYLEYLHRFSEFFLLSKNNLVELFDNGYYDAKINKEFFDVILEKRNIENETLSF
jgi:hypothetical protein